jgi:hypothetical protein
MAYPTDPHVKLAHFTHMPLSLEYASFFGLIFRMHVAQFNRVKTILTLLFFFLAPIPSR